MQESMRESMVYIGGVYGKRYRRRQKQRFVQYLERCANNSGLAAKAFEIPGAGGRKALHLCVGDLKKAKNVIMAPYDTPSRVFLPGSTYCPLDRKHNSRAELREMLFRFATAAALLAGCCAAAYPHLAAGGGAVWLGLLVLTAAVLFGAFQWIFGIPNKYNFRRGGGAIALMLDMMRRQKDRRTAYLFLDQGITSFEGYRQAAEHLGEQLAGKRLLLLDCIGRGEHLCLIGGDILQGQEPPQVQRTRELFPSGEVSWWGLSQEALADTVLSYFPSALWLVQADRTEGGPCVEGTRSGKDDQMDFARLEELETAVLGGILVPPGEDGPGRAGKAAGKQQ